MKLNKKSGQGNFYFHENSQKEDTKTKRFFNLEAKAVSEKKPEEQKKGKRSYSGEEGYDYRPKEFIDECPKCKIKITPTSPYYLRLDDSHLGAVILEDAYCTRCDYKVTRKAY